MTARWELRRILLAMDAASHSPPCLAWVVDLAARLQADIAGLFVEDDDLLRAAALPSARRVSFLTGADEAYDLLSTEQELRAMAAAIQRELADTAEPRRVQWSFQVARGPVAPTVASAAAACDVLVVQRSTRPLLSHLRLRSAARAAGDVVRASLLVLPAQPSRAAPVVMAYDGSPQADTVLRAGARFAAATSGVADLLLLAATDDQARALDRRARRLLAETMADTAVSLRCRRVAPRPDAIRAALPGDGSRLLVIGTDDRPPWRELREVADRLDLPLLMVRTGQPEP